MFSQKQFLLAGALLGFLGVALGAFGAHALKPMLIASGRLDTYELAVRYHFYHTFAIICVGIMLNLYSSQYLKLSGLMFLLGTIFFSGSLYTICFTSLTFFAFITPIGGVCLLIGWGFLFFSILKSNKIQS